MDRSATMDQDRAGPFLEDGDLRGMDSRIEWLQNSILGRYVDRAMDS